MNSIYLLLLFIGLSFADDRYIIKYDDKAWNTLHLNSLPEETVVVLKHLKMTIAELPPDELKMYGSIPGLTVTKDEELVLYDEQPGFVENDPPNWGLDRIDQRDLPLDNKYHFDATGGSGVDVYVIDSGVNSNHAEFGGRVKSVINFSNDNNETDCIGHGTHVASIIGGTFVGVAKGARIHGFKIFNCAGSSNVSYFLIAVDHVIGEHIKNSGQKSVINISLGQRVKNNVIDEAVETAVKEGITVVVAAGNDGFDACDTSPGSAPNVITVASSDANDQSARLTNNGPCVDIYAPGVKIYAAYQGSNNKSYMVKQGTSQASPHVAGAAALILGSGAATTPSEVKAKIKSVAIKDAIKGAPKGTPNDLLFIDPVWMKSF